MKGKRNIRIRNNARFIIAIDDDFNFVSMTDLNKDNSRLDEKESYSVLVTCFSSMKQIVDTLESKVKEKEKNYFKNLIKRKLTLVK